MMEIKSIYKSQKEFFNSKKTLSIKYRKQSLRKLSIAISKHESSIYEALMEDLGKSQYESFLSEILFVQKEIKMMVKNIGYWAKPKRVPGSIYNFPSRDYIIPKPFGCVLNISPWNYPFNLALVPLVGAVAAGNTVVLKPSEHSPNTSKILITIIKETFEPGHVSVVIGDAKEAQQLLSLRWDYIFFTGSTSIGKIVAKAAAEFLTPTTLELGGKNPCVVEESSMIKLTAKRIVWGKFFNCGQTCIAPDYIMVNYKIKDKLIAALKIAIKDAFGEKPIESKSYGRLINKNHLDRINKMMKGASIIHGGDSNSSDKFFAPTLLLDQNLESGAMQEEIFGPILPIISYENIEETYDIINRFEKPLGAYLFSKNKKSIERFKNEVSAGAIVVNDSIIQFINSNLPFGGVGSSGVGAYHGEHSFDLFTHFKPFIKRSFFPDPFLRYAPYPKNWGWIKKILKYV
jgi:aldehyde dehydrogenase (NAD+)|tara:strand:- start:496 stop:1872 length:1377 start_codon:yes stop_codon:yes gene_type:complete